MFHIKGYILWQRTFTLTFPVHELSALDWSEKWFSTCSSFTIWSIWMKLHRYVDHQRLHIVGKDRRSYLSRLWVIHPWLIWELVFDLKFISSVHAHCFRSITWVFMHRIFSNFAYILLLGMSGTGLLMGKIRPFSMELLPFLPLKNGFWPVILLLFITSQIWWTAKVTYYNEGPSLLPFQFMSYPPLINLENVLTCSSFTIWNIWMKLHRYVDHQR